MGALVHLGMGLTYPSDAALRSKCYDLPRDDASRQLQQLVAPVVARMTDTPACIETTVGLLMVLADRPPEDLIHVLSALDMHLPVKRLLSAADSRVDRLIRHICRRLEAAHQSITGRAMNRANAARAADEIEAIINRIGLRRFSDTLMAAPHGIRVRRGTTEPYVYIVLEGAGRLLPWIWLSGRPPKRIYAAARLGAGEIGTVLICRRRQRKEQRRKPRIPRRHTPHPRQDTRHHAPVLTPDSVRAGERIVRPD